MIKSLLSAYCAFALLLSGCSTAPKNGLKVAATAVPHAQML